MDTAGELSPFRWFWNSTIYAYSGEIFEKGRGFPRSEFYYRTLINIFVVTNNTITFGSGNLESVEEKLIRDTASEDKNPWIFMILTIGIFVFIVDRFVTIYVQII